METLIWLSFVTAIGGILVIAGLLAGGLMLHRNWQRMKAGGR